MVLREQHILEEINISRPSVLDEDSSWLSGPNAGDGLAQDLTIHFKEDAVEDLVAKQMKDKLKNLIDKANLVTDGSVTRADVINEFRDTAIEVAKTSGAKKVVDVIEHMTKLRDGDVYLHLDERKTLAERVIINPTMEVMSSVVELVTSDVHTPSEMGNIIVDGTIARKSTDAKAIYKTYIRSMFHLVNEKKLTNAQAKEMLAAMDYSGSRNDKENWPRVDVERTRLEINQLNRFQ